MKTGSLVMIDTLGFKGIWNRESPSRVIDKLGMLKEVTSRVVKEAFGPSDSRPNDWVQKVEVSFISDTVVLAFPTQDIERVFSLSDKSELTEKHLSDFERIKSSGVYWACCQVSLLMAMGALPPAPMAYRGCVSYGDFEMRDNFFVGPAVDDAGACMNLAQGAFVWLTPKALKVFSPLLDPEVVDNPRFAQTFLKWKVPLKNGDSFETVAVSPHLNCKTKEQRDKTTKSILDSFVGGLDVIVKKQNTERFLKECDNRWQLDEV